MLNVTKDVGGCGCGGVFNLCWNLFSSSWQHSPLYLCGGLLLISRFRCGLLDALYTLLGFGFRRISRFRKKEENKKKTTRR